MKGPGAPGDRVLPLMSLAALALVPLGLVAIEFGLMGTSLALAVVVAGVRRRCWSAVRVATLTVLLAVVGLLGVPFSLWLAVGLLWMASRRWPRLRPDQGWFTPGHGSAAA